MSDFRLPGKSATRVSPGADSFSMPRSNVPPRQSGSDKSMDEYHLAYTTVHEFSFRLLSTGTAEPCDDGHPALHRCIPQRMQNTLRRGGHGTTLVLTPAHGAPRPRHCPRPGPNRFPQTVEHHDEKRLGIG